MSLNAARLLARAEATRSPGFAASSAIEKLRRRRENAKAAITRGVATIRALLQEPGTPTVEIHKQLGLINGNYVEMKVLDKCIWENLDDDEFDADLSVSYEFNTELKLARTLTSPDPPRLFPTWLLRIPERETLTSPFRHGKATVLSGEGKITAEAENVANVHPACKPRFLRTASPGQVGYIASGPLEGAPSSPPCEDCVVFAGGHSTELAMDPDPSMTCTDVPGVAAARERSIPREHDDRPTDTDRRTELGLHEQRYGTGCGS